MVKNGILFGNLCSFAFMLKLIFPCKRIYEQMAVWNVTKKQYYMFANAKLEYMLPAINTIEATFFFATSLSAHLLVN